MKVSVVIPTHKRFEVLKRALDSVLNQTFQDFEIIVVSDGYDKDTDIVMLQYKENEKVDYYYYEKAQGGNYARNYGISKSTGEYIAFLDDDDVWEKNKLEMQMNLFRNHQNIGLVYTGHKQVYVGSNIEIYYFPTKEGDLSDIIFEKNYIGSTSSIVVRKSILEKVGYFDESLPAMQDYELWIRICQETLIGLISQPLLLYYNDLSQKQISSQVQRQIEAKSRIEEKHKDYYNSHPRALEMFDKRLFETIIKISKANNDIQELRKFSKEYIYRYPSLRTRLFLISFKLPYKTILYLKAWSNRLIQFK